MSESLLLVSYIFVKFQLDTFSLSNSPYVMSRFFSQFTILLLFSSSMFNYNNNNNITRNHYCSLYSLYQTVTAAARRENKLMLLLLPILYLLRFYLFSCYKNKSVVGIKLCCKNHYTKCFIPNCTSVFLRVY